MGLESWRSLLKKSPLIDRYSLSLSLSIAVHLSILAWLVHSPPPTFISPTSIRQGQNGTSVSTIYFAGSPEVSRPHLPSKAYLPLNQPARRSTPPPKPDSLLESDSPRNEATLLPNQRPVGSPYGSLSYGTLFGPDVRPALPVFFPDPVIEPSELPNGQGDVIVEVTIDDQGNVVQEVLVQSVSPSIDQKVLAAVARWHFRAATRNTVPIASKQDVYYHFPR